MRRTPLRPSNTASENASLPIPFGLTAPIPVMTQRRFMMLAKSKFAPIENNRNGGGVRWGTRSECQKLVIRTAVVGKKWLYSDTFGRLSGHLGRECRHGLFAGRHDLSGR